MSDTTLKIPEEVRDRLRQVADERGISTRALVESLADTLTTEAERAEATARGLAYVRQHLHPDMTEEDLDDTEQWRRNLLNRQGGNVR